jgi:WD40 repeat protein
MLRSRLCFCVLCAVLATALALLLMTYAPQTSLAKPAAPPSAAGGRGAGGGPVSFINDIAPILKESCFGCHGAKNPKGKLDMTHYESLRRGGTKEDPIVPGKPEDSYLINVLTAMDKKRMPPAESGDPLSRDKIDLVSRWIKEGAKLDPSVKKEADLLKELRVRWTPPLPFAAYPYAVTITALAFTPDNKKLVVGGHHELTVWDFATGKLEKRIRTRARRAMAMVFLKDGKLAVAGGRPGEEGDVRIYNIDAGTPKTEGGATFVDGVNDKTVMIKHLLDTDDEVLCLALSSDGKKLASGGCDRMVNVWDLGGGYDAVKAETPIENHADWVFGVAFSPDGKYLLTCSRDKTAKMWDLGAKESVLTFPDHQNGVYGVAIKADGKTAYSVGEDNLLRAWNSIPDKGGKQIRAGGGHTKAVLKVVPVPGKPMLVTCSADMTVRIFNADTLGVTKALTGHTDHVFAVAVSPDANLIASGAFNGEVRVWKVADGALVKSFNASPGLKVAAPPAVVPKK